MEWSSFEHLMELRNSGRIEDAVRESKALLAEATDDDDKASLLTGAVVFCCTLGRLNEARQMLGQLKELHISNLESRLNAEFCEPCLLMLEGKSEEAISAFSAILTRHREILTEERFCYLYEDIQCRRALALFDLSRLTEALPILKEAISFSFEETADEQRVHFGLGVCFEHANDAEGAKQEYFRVVAFHLKNELEERARYRLARILVIAGAFAQARKQLEIIVQDYPPPSSVVPREYIYAQLSHVCQHLGDDANAKPYKDLVEAGRLEKRTDG